MRSSKTIIFLRKAITMIIKETTFTSPYFPIIPNNRTPEELLYFDIETTGLSASSSYVYLIGCAFFQNEQYHLLQWLATEPSEEKELISLFLSHAKNFSCLVQFNGTAFDIPFLEKKCTRHCLPFSLIKLEQIDYYKLLQPYKKLLSLPNLKLRTLSSFLQMQREDPFSGAELTTLYTAFVGKYKMATLTGQTKEADALEAILLLHNKEDLTILPAIGAFTETLSSLASADVTVTSIEVQETMLQLTLSSNHQLLFPYSLQNQEPTPQLALSHFDKHLFPFTLQIQVLTETYSIVITKKEIVLSVPLYTGELKHFFPNYKDYFYLPLEDTAIHASIASFVEKEYRKKATAATCYVKKQGTFFPCPAQQITQITTDTKSNMPLFFSEYKSKLPYYLLAKELLTDIPFWNNYSNSILSFLFAQKTSKPKPASKINTEIN